MNKTLAIYITKLISEDLDIPSCMSEKIEHNLINDSFEKVEEFVMARARVIKEYSKGNLVRESDTK